MACKRPAVSPPWNSQLVQRPTPAGEATRRLPAEVQSVGRYPHPPSGRRQADQGRQRRPRAQYRPRNLQRHRRPIGFAVSLRRVDLENISVILLQHPPAHRLTRHFRSASSHVSQVLQGVIPPAQLFSVPAKLAYAPAGCRRDQHGLSTSHRSRPVVGQRGSGGNGIPFRGAPISWLQTRSSRRVDAGKQPYRRGRWGRPRLRTGVTPDCATTCKRSRRVGHEFGRVRIGKQRAIAGGGRRRSGRRTRERRPNFRRPRMRNRPRLQYRRERCDVKSRDPWLLLRSRILRSDCCELLDR